MTEKKFDSKKLEKLNNPQRLKDIPPDYIIEKLNIKSPDVITDIGAGTGVFSMAFCEHLNPSLVYACDLSDVMIDWIKENVNTRCPKIIPVKNEENFLPLDNEISDLAFMITLHHELDNPLLILKEVNRILKPGGKFFIVDWKKEDMAEGPPEKIRVFPEEAARQAKEAGFINVLVFNDMAKHFLVTGEKL
ncbi:MAG: class I SAM-dependent methyltransferase [Desulfobacteraceae bacterium]|nr:class I SAM-dependent methyltransferase [Desulfobacteraceae bacterium]MCB9494640.1 class I SAM-dependent methyltransferase [Desulfobacteraceae bacterium]